MENSVRGFLHLLEQDVAKHDIVELDPRGQAVNYLPPLITELRDLLMRITQPVYRNQLLDTEVGPQVFVDLQLPLQNVAHLAARQQAPLDVLAARDQLQVPPEHGICFRHRLHRVGQLVVQRGIPTPSGVFK